MSEQQQLHNPTFGHVVSNRQPVASYMVPIVPQGSRLDNFGVPQNAAQQYFFCPRVPDPPQQLYRGIDPSFYLPQEFPAINHNEFGAFSLQQLQHMVYQPVIPTPATMPTTVSNVTTLGNNQKPYVERQRRPLVVEDPDTKCAINFESLDTDSVKHSQNSAEYNEPLLEATKDVRTKSRGSPLLDLSEQEEPDKITPDVNSEPVELDNANELINEVPDATVSEEEEQEGDVIAENGIDDKSETDDFKSESSDENEPETLVRRVYSRSVILSLKSSPVSQCNPKDLVLVSNYRLMKMHSRSHRTPHRVIRLPTGLSIKRIEDAFVPTKMRKDDKNTPDDPKKILSQKMSIILNRLSVSNLLKTASEIRNLKLSCPEDLQILANLTFQKAIRQTKYSKIFAQLINELKGFSFSGSQDFELLVLAHVQELFNTPLTTVLSELHATIDKRIADSKDEDIKKLIEDDRKTIVAKKTDAYYGNIMLLAELYLCRLVPPKTMTSCLKKLRESQTQEAPTSLMLLLNACGALFEDQCKTALDACFDRLRALVKAGDLPAHQVFKVEELIELRKRGWKKPVVSEQSPLPQSLPDRRFEDKSRFSNPPTGRRTKPTDHVIPINLTVSSQSSDDSLKPNPKLPWSQGSRCHKSDDSTQATKSRPALSMQNHSRDASPYVHAKPPQPVEDYDSMLQRLDSYATTVVAILSSKEEDPMDLFKSCKSNDRPALLHLVLEKVVERKPDDREAVGKLLYRLAKHAMTSEQLIAACERFLPTCDEDWLTDVPSGWRNLADIFHHLIQGDDEDYLPTLIRMITPLAAQKQASAIVLAHCLNLAAARLGADYVGEKFRSRCSDWTKLGIPAADIPTFVSTHSVQFTVSGSSEPDYKQALVDLEKNSASSDFITDLFRKMSLAPLPKDFVKDCTITLVKSSKGLPRHEIDKRAVSLGLLVDHDSEKEQEVLNGLRECSSSGVPIDQWPNSLLAKKVISSEACDTLSKSGRGASKSVEKTLPTKKT